MDYLIKEDVEKISSGIVEACSNNVTEFYSEAGLAHKNAFHMLKWDYIFTNVRGNLKDSKLKCLEIKRGCFTLDLIIDEKNKYIFSVINEKNVNSIRKTNNRDHYFWRLTSINKGLKSKDSQVSLFDNTNEEVLLDDLLKDVSFIPQKYISIVIEKGYGNNINIFLRVYNENLEEVESEEIYGSIPLLVYDIVKENTNIPSNSKNIKLKLKDAAKEKIKNKHNFELVSPDTEEKI